MVRVIFNGFLCRMLINYFNILEDYFDYNFFCGYYFWYYVCFGNK